MKKTELFKKAARLRTAVVIAMTMLCVPVMASADVVLDWNATALAMLAGQNPFNQARILAITQLAVFEAVNAVTGEYAPYLGTVSAPAGASERAAAIAAPSRSRR